ncbi:hypothetical protein PF002_g14458 [Phytophthora fragariae]|uniref:Protein kinase domain-containing protein n=1 Tax=Phytophthora fragariae TaxID=53985 RepID=A0A6A3YY15_9STRA|nr:hypothetical protein PF002_g14458 [Phytophthora fragariae]
MAPIPRNPGADASESPNAALDHKKWDSVKTWTFAQLLASSFAKASLEDAMRTGSNSPSSSIESVNKTVKETGSNDWDCSYSCLKTVSSSAPTSGNNDWDCSYSSLKPVASRPTISASSSSSTLLSDADTTHLQHSIEELFEHEETVEEESEDRDPARYVFDIVRIIGSGSYGTVLLCRLRACPNRLFAVKVVYKSKLGSINGLDGDRNATREARRLLTEKKSAMSDEEENHFYFGDFDWCADASHFQ